MKYIVHYQLGDRLLSTLPTDSLDLANWHARHLRTCGFEAVIIEAVTAQDDVHVAGDRSFLEVPW
jgi:hypothetical protein